MSLFVLFSAQCIKYTPYTYKRHTLFHVMCALNWCCAKNFRFSFKASHFSCFFRFSQFFCCLSAFVHFCCFAHFICCIVLTHLIIIIFHVRARDALTRSPLSFSIYMSFFTITLLVQRWHIPYMCVCVCSPPHVSECVYTRKHKQ